MMAKSEMTAPTKQRKLPWVRIVFVASAAAVPISYRIGAALSGENHFGQGLEGGIYWAAFWGAQALSFFGFVLSPCSGSGSERRQGVLMILALVAFVLDEALSFGFIAFGMFPD